MLQDWKPTRIGDICKTNQHSYSVSEKWPFVNYLDTGNITENRISEIQHIVMGQDILPSRARRKVAIDDILYSTVRPNQRHYGIVKEVLPNMLVSTGFTVITADKAAVDSDFLYYYLTQNDIVDSLHAIGEQSVSAYPSIKPSDIEGLEMMLPSLEEQREIGRTLRALDDKIANNTKINHHLEQMAQAMFKSWFVDFEPFGGEMPNDWREGTLGDIIELFDFKRVPLSGNERDKMAKIYPYYGAATLMDYVDDYLFDGIYLLLGEDGTVIDNLGFPTLQYVWGKFWVNNHAHILQGQNGFTVESLYVLLKQMNVTSIVTGAVQPKINQANLKALDVLIPSADVIEQFNALIAPLFAKIRVNHDENLYLADTRDALLPKLISGELSIVDLNNSK